jgi:hypothetical protein
MKSIPDTEIGEARADGISLSTHVQEGLRKAGISEEIIFALEVAMAYSGTDPYARSHAHGIMPAWDRYGVEGVHLNVQYMLGCLGKWQGEQARNTKKILKKWRLLV